MLLLRSLLFTALFYLWSVFWVLLILPLVLAPRRWIVRSWRTWGLGVMFLLRVVCGIRVEFRGRQFIPAGHALIAPKHQCMFDVFAQFTVLPDSCFVTKKELMWIPFFGWYAAKARMIVVDRAGHAAALRKLVADAKIRRVVLCSGKVYYDLYEEREKRGIDDIYLLRVEQLYPFPLKALVTELSRFKKADVLWCQEEPKNMGAWSFVEPYLEWVLGQVAGKSKRARYTGRPASAATATGLMSKHLAQLKAFLDEALAE